MYFPVEFAKPSRNAMSRLSDWWPALVIVGLAAFITGLPDGSTEALLGF